MRRMGQLIVPVGVGVAGLGGGWRQQANSTDDGRTCGVVNCPFPARASP